MIRGESEDGQDINASRLRAARAAMIMGAKDGRDEKIGQIMESLKLSRRSIPSQPVNSALGIVKELHADSF